MGEPNPYLRTKVMTASPVELRLLLIEGAIRFLRSGREGLEAKDYEKSYNGISRAQHILIELINGLHPEAAPELCEQISALYTFMYTRLVSACTERDPEMVTEVLKLLDYERETWQLAHEKQQAGQLPSPDDSPERLSVSG